VPLNVMPTVRLAALAIVVYRCYCFNLSVTADIDARLPTATAITAVSSKEEEEKISHR